MKLFLISIIFFINFFSFSNDKVSNSMLCSSIYFISGAAFADNQNASKMMAGLQETFELIYTANQSKIVTIGDMSKLKHQHLMYLSDLFDRDRTRVIQIEMQCNAWRESVSKKLASFFQSEMNQRELMQAVRTLPKIQKKNYTSDHPRWSKSKSLVYLSFQKWDAMDRITPYKFQQNLMKD